MVIREKQIKVTMQDHELAIRSAKLKRLIISSVGKNVRKSVLFSHC